MSAADSILPNDRIAETTYRGEFFHDFTREEAERVLYYHPCEPILRPCSYTPRFPTVFALSYVPASRQIHHTLVERLPEGRYRAVMDTTGDAGELRITPAGGEWASEAELYTFIRSRSTRFPSPLMYSFHSTSASAQRPVQLRAPLLRASSGAHTAAIDAIVASTATSIVASECPSDPTEPITSSPTH